MADAIPFPCFCSFHVCPAGSLRRILFFLTPCLRTPLQYRFLSGPKSVLCSSQRSESHLLEQFSFTNLVSPDCYPVISFLLVGLNQGRAFNKIEDEEFYEKFSRLGVQVHM